MLKEVQRQGQDLKYQNLFSMHFAKSKLDVKGLFSVDMVMYMYVLFSGQ